MIKDVLGLLDYSLFAEAALLLFAIAFVAVTIRTLRGCTAGHQRFAAAILAGDGDGDEGGREHE